MKNLYIKTKNLIFKNKITKIVAAVLLVLLALLLFKFIMGRIKGDKGEAISQNQVVTLSRGSVTNSVTEKGKVVPSNSVEVYAEKPLPVTHVNVKVGDKVKKGDIIAELDSSSIEQQLKSRRAQKSATDKNVSAQISAAKKRLEEAISGRNSGKNPSIVAAEASLTYDDFKRSLDESYNQGIIAEKGSRENLAYQEEATDLKYRQLQDEMNKNANKISDNRAMAADKSRQKDYLQANLDNEKRRMTEISISIKEEQGRLAEAQEKVASLQTEITSLGAKKSQLEAQLQQANLELNQPQNTPEKKQEIQKTINDITNQKNLIDNDIKKKKITIEAINFE